MAGRSPRGAGEELGVLGEPITSPQNAVVKRAAGLRLRKFRDREGAFLAEGADLVAAGIAAGHRPQVVFVRRGSAAEAAAAGGTLGGAGGAATEVGATADLTGVAAVVAGMADAPAPVPAALAGLTVYPVSDRVAAKVSTLETPPDVMAVFARPQAAPLEALGGGGQGGLSPGGRAPLVVYADRIADPGNMGTLLRAAAAFGAAALVTAPGSVDVFGPKSVRASMGALFALPVYHDATLGSLLDRLGLTRIYGLVAHGGAPLASAELQRPAVLCVGAERAGLAPDTLARVTDPLTIELAPASIPAGAADVLDRPGPAVESLNAGVAGAIALYEFARRRAGASDEQPPAPAASQEG